MGFPDEKGGAENFKRLFSGEPLITMVGCRFNIAGGQYLC
jgi:hypothetical protein